MTISLRKKLIWSGLLACLSFQLAAKPPEIPVPNNAQISIVGQNMTVGGKTMSIKQLYSRDKLDKVKEFYYRRWEKGERPDMPGYLESDAMAPWHIISRLEEGYLLTVQIQAADNGGTWGYLGTSKLTQGDSNTSRADEVPRMAGSEIIHDMQTRDIGQSGETLMLSNRHSLASNANYYKNYYLQRGWRTDLDQPIPTANMHVLAFTNGREKINIVLTGDNNNTRIVVNKVDHDLL